MDESNGKDANGNGKTNGKSPPAVEKVDLTDIFGEFGRYQIALGLIVMVSTILGNWNVIGYTFFTYPMDHWCARPERFNNVSVDMWKKLVMPLEKDHGKMVHSKCKMYDLSGYSDSESLLSSYEKYVATDRTNETWKPSSDVVSCTEWEFDTSFFQTTILHQWSIICDHSWKASMSQSVYMVGFFIAVLLFGQIGDKFGRRPVLLACVLLQQIGGFAVAFSPNFIFFVIMRFFVSMGTHGFYTTGFVVCLYRNAFGASCSLLLLSSDISHTHT